MKKAVLLAAVLVAGTSAFAAKNDCGCAAGDVACVNSCTLSKVSTLKQNYNNKKQQAVQQVKVVKTTVAANQADQTAQAKADAKAAAAAKKAELKAQAE